MKQEIVIENLKCGGCASTIVKGLDAIEGVENTSVDVEKSLVQFFADESQMEKVKEKLSSMGYPAVGEKNTTLHKAKSFVSCAVGKMSS